MNTESDELIIPVYLNQRIVFDLIAMLQDGMSTVTRVSSSEESKSVDNQRYGTSFGLGQALSSLLKFQRSPRNTPKQVKRAPSEQFIPLINSDFIYLLYSMGFFKNLVLSNQAAKEAMGTEWANSFP